MIKKIRDKHGVEHSIDYNALENLPNIPEKISDLVDDKNLVSLVDGVIPSNYLPGYVDDVLEFENFEGFPAEGESGKIYLDSKENKSYRWTGTKYAEISSTLALGETSSTAYAGDKGKANADAIVGLNSTITNILNGTTKLNYENLENIPTIPTKISDLTNDSEFATRSELFSGSYNDLLDKPTSLPASDVYDWAKSSTKPTYSKDEIGLENVTNDAQVKRSEMGTANGVATLDENGKVPSSQLPGYVDDVIEGKYVSATTFNDPDGNIITAESGKIYLDTVVNKSYRWSGSQYAEISSSVALGETASTAFAGNRGVALENTVSGISSSVNTLQTTVQGANDRIDSVINGVDDFEPSSIIDIELEKDAYLLVGEEFDAIGSFSGVYANSELNSGITCQILKKLKYNLSVPAEISISGKTRAHLLCHGNNGSDWFKFFAIHETISDIYLIVYLKYTANNNPKYSQSVIYNSVGGQFCGSTYGEGWHVSDNVFSIESGYVTELSNSKWLKYLIGSGSKFKISDPLDDTLYRVTGSSENKFRGLPDTNIIYIDLNTSLSTEETAQILKEIYEFVDDESSHDIIRYREESIEGSVIQINTFLGYYTINVVTDRIKDFSDDILFTNIPLEIANQYGVELDFVGWNPKLDKGKHRLWMNTSLGGTFNTPNNTDYIPKNLLYSLFSYNATFATEYTNSIVHFQNGVKQELQNKLKTGTGVTIDRKNTISSKSILSESDAGKVITAVPSSGNVKDIYLNTQLSNSEILDIISGLNYIDVSSLGFEGYEAVFIYASESMDYALSVVRSGEYYFISLTDGSNVSDLWSSYGGWDDEIINPLTINNTNALSALAPMLGQEIQNEKLSKIFSITNSFDDAGVKYTGSQNLLYRSNYSGGKSAVPNSGYVDKIYFNKDADLLEFYPILEEYISTYQVPMYVFAADSSLSKGLLLYFLDTSNLIILSGIFNRCIRYYIFDKF